MDFTQNDIEKDIADLVPYRVRKDVAKRTAIYESVVYGYFNPDDERKSPAFCALLIQNALDEIDAEVGERVWAAICRFRELSRPHTGIHQVSQPDLECTVIDEACDVQKWLARFDIPTAERRELVQFVDECKEAEDAIAAARSQAVARIKQLGMEARFPGAKVDHSARAVGERIVGKARVAKI